VRDVEPRRLLRQRTLLLSSHAESRQHAPSVAAHTGRVSSESPGQQRVLRPDDPGYERADEARRTGPVRGRAAAAREAIRKRPALDRAYRTGVKLVGGTTVGLGIVLMPLPGPGTLIALGGLAILGTESERAHTLNARALRAARAAAASAQRRRDARRAARAQRPYRASTP
jgi:hypothetical protein